MNTHEKIKERIVKGVWESPNQRVRPIELEKKLEKEHGFAQAMIKEALKELIGEGELVFTYRDPSNYVEIPPAESHHAVRPLKFIKDQNGEPWICDVDVDPFGNLIEQGCWRCRDLAFTASD